MTSPERSAAHATALRTPIWKEYLCKRRARKMPNVTRQDDGDESPGSQPPGSQPG